MPRSKAENENPFQKLQAQIDAKAREIGVEVAVEPYTLEWYREDWLNRKRIFIEREIKVATLSKKTSWFRLF